MVSSSGIAYSASRDDGETAPDIRLLGSSINSSCDCARRWFGDDWAQEFELVVLGLGLLGELVSTLSIRGSRSGNTPRPSDSSESLKKESFFVSERVRSENETLCTGSFGGTVDIEGEFDFERFVWKIAFSGPGCGGDTELFSTALLDAFFTSFAGGLDFAGFPLTSVCPCSMDNLDGCLTCLGGIELLTTPGAREGARGRGLLGESGGV